MKDPNKDRESFGTNVFNNLTNLMDKYIREIRYGLYGLGLISVVMISRSIYATKVITRASDIPKEFIEKAVKLQGQVRAVGSKGVLYVQHRPILRLLPSRWRGEDKDIPLHLSLVEVTPMGSKWLQDHMIQKHVWFQIMSIKEDRVSSAVYVRKRFGQSCVNLTLVQEGLCVTQTPSGDELSAMTKHEHDLLQQMVLAESVATKKKKGMFKVVEEKKKERNGAEKLKTVFSKLFYLPVTFINWIKKRRK